MNFWALRTCNKKNLKKEIHFNECIFVCNVIHIFFKKHNGLQKYVIRCQLLLINK